MYTVHPAASCTAVLSSVRPLRRRPRVVGGLAPWTSRSAHSISMITAFWGGGDDPCRRLQLVASAQCRDSSAQLHGGRSLGDPAGHVPGLVFERLEDFSSRR